jgi:hypothetical protein
LPESAAFHCIGDEIAESHFLVVAGEKKMGKKIHFTGQVSGPKLK